MTLNKELTIAELTQKCVDKPVKIKKNYKHIVAGTVGRVIDYDNKNVYIDEYGNYPVTSHDDIEIVTFTEDMNLNAGQKAILVKKYRNFKWGQEVVIQDFLDENKNKVIIEGIIPGGWINAKDLTPPINFQGLRVKTYLELFAEYGWKFINIFSLHYDISKLLGKPLTADKVSRLKPNGYYDLKNDWVGYTIPKCFTSNEPNNKTDLKIYVKSAEFINSYSKYNGENSENIAKLLKLAGKPLIEIYGRKFEHSAFISPLSALRAHGYIITPNNETIRGVHLEAR